MAPKIHVMMHPKEAMLLPQDHILIQVIKLVSGIGMCAQNTMQSWWGWIWEKVKDKVPSLRFGKGE
jgi:hypothetical protein